MENPDLTASMSTPEETRQRIRKMAVAIEKEVEEGVPLSPVDERLLAMRERIIEDVILTTETQLDLNIIKRVEIIHGQSAFEIKSFKDFTAGLLKPLRGQTNQLNKQLEELRKDSLRTLKGEAFAVGANAVVGIKVDLSTITIGQISMMMMVASGTAVIIEE